MRYLLGIYTILLPILFGCSEGNVAPQEAFKGLELPSHFGAPVYDIKANPITKEGFELGKELFNDPILSLDSTVSCGSCHLQEGAFSQPDHDFSHGINDLLTHRNTQAIQNLAWNTSFLWDGGVFHLDLFPPSPISAPNEMGESMRNVLVKLQRLPRYRTKFLAAFGSEEITTDRFLKALSQFQLMCISDNSPFDRYWKNNKLGYLTENQLKGLSIFNNKCGNCHSGVLQTDHSFRRNGLKIKNAEQTGRFAITQQEADKYKFRVPTLRNLAFTAPYMHDGRFKTLDEVLEHYANGMEKSANLDVAFLQDNGKVGIEINATEKALIIDFLKSLNDTSFVRNPILAP